MICLDFKNQTLAKDELAQLAAQDKHSIMIEGPEGCGKTFLAKYFAHQLHCDDFQVITPKVQDLKSAIEECYQISTPVVLCIENLDAGVVAASYALLKFLEEPLSYVYILVTCRSREQVPDTIVSRSAVVTVGAPTHEDVLTYAKDRNFEKFFSFKDMPIWKAIKSFGDVDTLFKLTKENVEYIQTLPMYLKSNDAVSNTMWKLQKFPDNESTPLVLVIRYILCTEPKYWFVCHTCLQELAIGQIAAHAVLAKFLLDCKYAVR